MTSAPLPAPSFSMDHLRPPALPPEAAEAARKQVEASASKDSAEVKDDPRDQPTWTFPFRFVDAKGRVWDGTFTNRILDVGAQMVVDQLCARRTGGLPQASFSERARNDLYMVSHLEVSLTADRPDWAKDLLAIRNPGMLQALYAEVASHEATFLGLGEAPPPSQGGSEQPT